MLSIVCHGQIVDNDRPVLVFLGRMKSIAVIGAGISGLAAAYSAEPPASGAPVREGAPAGRPHQYRDRSRARRAPWRSTPASSSTTTAPIRTWCGCSRSSAWRPATRTCPSRCRADGAGSSTAAAAPTGSSRSGGTWCSPSHLSLLREIVRFNREAPALLSAPDAERQTLGDFLESRRFGEGFTHRYLFPMASAIWSASLDAIRSFPALTLIRFFDNHGLLSLNAQPTWKVVAGGSHTYIPRLIGAAVGRTFTRAPRLQSVRRSEDAVTIDLPRSAVDAVRRGGVRVPRRSGAAAPRRSERSRARRVLELHHHDQRRLAAHRRVGAARCRRGPARRGTTGSPATPTRRRR